MKSLRFTPQAWAKLICMRDAGPTEVGGFGIAHDPTDPLLIHDVAIVRQTCSSVTTDLDDAAVADFFDEQVDLGRQPEQFGRVWIHSHPGDSAKPSGTDEKTFREVFGSTDWAVMAILACGGETYARFRTNSKAGPVSTVLSVEIDWSTVVGRDQWKAWEAERKAKVDVESDWAPIGRNPFGAIVIDDDDDEERELARRAEYREAHESFLATLDDDADDWDCLEGDFNAWERGGR